MEKSTIRILLVEDDEDDYVLTRSLLEEVKCQNFQLEWISSFDLAIKLIRRKCHDVYLIDYRLGEHNGLELLHKAIESGVKAPIIFLTGVGDWELDLEAMKAGAADYLVKGQIDARLLERSIRYALERKRILDELRQSEERYALAVRGTTDGIWDWNLITDEVFFSPRWKAMLGYKEEELENNIEEWFQRVHPEDRERVTSIVHAHVGGLTRSFKHEYRILHRDGTYRWMMSRAVAVRDEDGKTLRIAGSQTDITSRKAFELRLMREALYDPLTGLPNRALFLDRLNRAIERGKRRGEFLFAVLFMDLDNFKKVNDHLGHLMGDQLLIKMRERLQSCLRPGDTVSRFGGDEFTILLEDLKDESNATMVANRIQKQLTPPVILSNQKIAVSASIGIVTSATGGMLPDELLASADAAMYRAKSQGKAQHILFEPGMRENPEYNSMIRNDWN